MVEEMMTGQILPGSTDDQSDVLQTLTQAYLESRRFNGLSLEGLGSCTSLSAERVMAAVRDLVRSGLASVASPRRHPNPHIKAHAPPSVEDQLAELDELADTIFVYPERAHLETVIDPAEFEGRPFTLRLALGEPQLKPEFFDLTVLEIYRNDPRYAYSHNDVSGSISLATQDDEGNKVPDRDHIFLQTFGFGYDSELNRAVASFLWYLSQLTPEHQQIWAARRVDGDFALHPDYFDSHILGKWTDHVPLFHALVAEQRIINEMTRAMERPPLFRRTYDSFSKPKELCFLIRPTLREFNDFVLALDKLLSDNISHDFFRGEVDLEEEREIAEGRVRVSQKGTLRLLEEWFQQNFVFEDPAPLDEALRVFREVRRLRQAPAHSLKEDEFDQGYFRRQRDLSVRVYRGLRTIRLALANDPRTRDVGIPEPIRRGRIRTR